MHRQSIAALAQLQRSHVPLGKSRIETFSLLVTGMIGARTVNLGHIACERPAEP